MSAEKGEHDSIIFAQEPSWDEIDVRALPREAFAFVGRADERGTWGYPHHWVCGGRLYLHREGLERAWREAGGDESRKRATEQVIAHLAAHRREIAPPNAAGRTAELCGVEIFEAGQRGGTEFTEADLDRMVANWRKHSAQGLHPPLVLGHGEDQDLLRRSGLPAAGWVSGLRRAGRKLLADFRGVPERVARLVGSSAYRKRSVEIYRDYAGDGPTLRRVALLGADIPEIKTLADVEAVYLSEDGRPEDIITATFGPRGAGAAEGEDKELAAARSQSAAFAESERRRAEQVLREAAMRRAMELCRRFGLGAAMLEKMAALLASDGTMKFGEQERPRSEVAWEVFNYIADERNRVRMEEIAGAASDAGGGGEPASPIRGEIPRDEAGDFKTAWCANFMRLNPGASFAEAFRSGAEAGWK